MGGSESEVGHPNFQSLYGESNSRGILVGWSALGGEEWPTPGGWGRPHLGSKNPGTHRAPGLAG